MLQHLYYGQRYHGVDFHDGMDAAGVAQAFGVRGVRIKHPDQLAAEIAQALNSTEPVFIDVPTRSELEEVPPVHAWQQAAREQATTQ
jgi:acetolactate synthase-1/2/3 large subunit